MNKARLDLELLLPDLPDERDECASRIIDALQTKKGIDKVHIIPENGATKAQLCLHYNPEIVTISQVEKLAMTAGADITSHYGHLLIETTGIRHPRHSRIIEARLKKVIGMETVSVSGTGFIQVEFDKKKTTKSKIIDAVSGLVSEIIHVDEHNGKLKTKLNGDVVHHQPVSHEDHEHKHAHNAIFGKNTELIFSIICGIFLTAGFTISFIEDISPTIPIIAYCFAYFFGGYYTTKEAIAGISKGKFEIDFLMLIAAVGAAALGEWAEGALLFFLFSLGHSLEHYAMEKARKSIAALAELSPKTALLKKENGLEEINIEDLVPSDIILVKPNTKIAADGIVVAGNSSVNQAPITGESIPVDKFTLSGPFDIKNAEKLDSKHKVYAGSINGPDVLEIKVTKLAADSTIARLVKLVNEAQTQKSSTQNFTDKIEKYYVPGVLVLVTLLLFAFVVVDEPFSKSFYRAMAVLVAASPCALAISTPSAVLSGVARAARGGVLVKGGKPLEELGSLTAIAFDKTGTLTEGKPKLTGVYPLNGISEEELLSIIIAVEKLSDHPLAAAIVKGGIEKLGKDVEHATNVQSITGRGVKADYRNSIIYIGNKELFTQRNYTLSPELKSKAEEYEGKGHTTMLVQKDHDFVGIITLMDVARPDAKETLASLARLGIKKMIMLTGDNQKVAEAIAKDIGITDAWGNLLPEEKVTAIDQLRKTEKKVAMVGDGVNDAPAMAKSTVGIAMGAAGSDVALETADIALMADKLNNLPFAIGLSKKAHQIIKQNIIISLGMVMILIPLTISGIASMGPAVIGHEGSTVIVVFNALRLMAYKK